MGKARVRPSPGARPLSARSQPRTPTKGPPPAAKRDHAADNVRGVRNLRLLLDRRASSSDGTRTPPRRSPSPVGKKKPPSTPSTPQQRAAASGAASSLSGAAQPPSREVAAAMRQPAPFRAKETALAQASLLAKSVLRSPRGGGQTRMTQAASAEASKRKMKEGLARIGQGLDGCMEALDRPEPGADDEREALPASPRGAGVRANRTDLYGALHTWVRTRGAERERGGDAGDGDDDGSNADETDAEEERDRVRAAEGRAARQSLGCLGVFEASLKGLVAHCTEAMGVLTGVCEQKAEADAEASMLRRKLRAVVETAAAQPVEELRGHLESRNRAIQVLRRKEQIHARTLRSVTMRYDMLRAGVDDEHAAHEELQARCDVLRSELAAAHRLLRRPPDTAAVATSPLHSSVSSPPGQSLLASPEVEAASAVLALECRSDDGEAGALMHEDGIASEGLGQGGIGWVAAAVARVGMADVAVQAEAGSDGLGLAGPSSSELENIELLLSTPPSPPPVTHELPVGDRLPPPLALTARSSSARSLTHRASGLNAIRNMIENMKLGRSFYVGMTSLLRGLALGWKERARLLGVQKFVTSLRSKLRWAAREASHRREVTGLRQALTESNALLLEMRETAGALGAEERLRVENESLAAEVQAERVKRLTQHRELLDLAENTVPQALFLDTVNRLTSVAQAAALGLAKETAAALALPNPWTMPHQAAMHTFRTSLVTLGASLSQRLATGQAELTAMLAHNDATPPPPQYYSRTVLHAAVAAAGELREACSGLDGVALAFQAAEAPRDGPTPAAFPETGGGDGGSNGDGVAAAPAKAWGVLELRNHFVRSFSRATARSMTPLSSHLTSDTPSPDPEAHNPSLPERATAATQTRRPPATRSVGAGDGCVAAVRSVATQHEPKAEAAPAAALSVPKRRRLRSVVHASLLGSAATGARAAAEKAAASEYRMVGDGTGGRGLPYASPAPESIDDFDAISSAGAEEDDDAWITAAAMPSSTSLQGISCSARRRSSLASPLPPPTPPPPPAPPAPQATPAAPAVEVATRGTNTPSSMYPSTLPPSVRDAAQRIAGLCAEIGTLRAAVDARTTEEFLRYKVVRETLRLLAASGREVARSAVSRVTLRVRLRRGAGEDAVSPAETARLLWVYFDACGREVAALCATRGHLRTLLHHAEDQQVDPHFVVLPNNARAYHNRLLQRHGSGGGGVGGATGDAPPPLVLNPNRGSDAAVVTSLPLRAVGEYLHVKSASAAATATATAAAGPTTSITTSTPPAERLPRQQAAPRPRTAERSQRAAASATSTAKVYTAAPPAKPREWRIPCLPRPSSATG